MNPRDRRHDADRRTRHRREVGDLARLVHPHLDHRDFVRGVERQERHGDADVWHFTPAGAAGSAGSPTGGVHKHFSQKTFFYFYHLVGSVRYGTISLEVGTLFCKTFLSFIIIPPREGT